MAAAFTAVVAGRKFGLKFTWQWKQQESVEYGNANSINPGQLCGLGKEMQNMRAKTVGILAARR